MIQHLSFTFFYLFCFCNSTFFRSGYVIVSSTKLRYLQSSASYRQPFSDSGTSSNLRNQTPPFTGHL